MWKHLILILILGVVMTGCHKSAVPLSDFFVMQASDLHVLSPELFDDSELLKQVEQGGDGKQIRDSYSLFQAMLQTVRAEQPDALILTGDLSFHGDIVSHQLIAKDLTELQTDGIPVYVLPGNHDWTTFPYGYFGEEGVPARGTSVEEFEAIYHSFGHDQAFSRDESSYSYAVEINPTTWLLMIDTNQPGMMSRLSSSTSDWAEHMIRTAEASGIQLITASHQNLFQHHALFSRGFRMVGAENLIEALEKYPPVIHLSGHMHVQHQVEQSGVREAATSSLAIWPHHIARIRPTGYQAASIALPEEDLTASHTFFRQASIDKAMSHFSDDPPNETVALAEYVADINEAYFSGNLTTLAELKEHPMAAAWASLVGEARFADYIQAILAETATDHRIKDFQ